MKSSDFLTTEAISADGRDEYIDYAAPYFINSPVIYSIDCLELKKAFYNGELYYGLFDDVTIVGLFHLKKYNNYLWQVCLIQIEEKYKGREYGTFLYDYAVMNDGLSFIADTVQSEGKKGGSRGLWERLYRHGRFTVCGYDLHTDTVIPFVNSSVIYNQKDDIVWMATPKPLKESINDMQYRLSIQNRHRIFEFYGNCINPTGYDI